MVVITGATSGIGLGLARRYADTGATVVGTGRDEGRLRAAERAVPGMVGLAGDLAQPGERERLASFVESEAGRLDVLVNNAGTQRRIGIADDDAPWPERQHELDLLLAAPIHLTTLLTPILLREWNNPAAPPTKQIVNVTSGGAFTPQPFAPAYSAAKAALHSYTENLRLAFAHTPVAVTELIPPAVATGFGDPAHPHGADPDEFCDAVFGGLEQRLDEVGFGPTATPDFIARLHADRERFSLRART